jgi:cytochrome c peroxidase
MTLCRMCLDWGHVANWAKTVRKSVLSLHMSLLLSVGLLVSTTASVMAQQSNLQEDALAELGRVLFFDKALSATGTQACASCHDPARAFVDSRTLSSLAPLSLGSDGVSLGSRNAPTLSYAALVPDLELDESGLYVGGLFHDGRASNLEAQASVPLLHPKEMAMASENAVLERLLGNSHYVEAFGELFGAAALQDAESAVDQFSEAIAAFERSIFFAPFDSKYDRYLRGEYTPTVKEQVGMGLFFSPAFTSCNQCHQLPSGSDTKREVFSNFRYENIGLPSNLELNSKNNTSTESIDEGLSANLLLGDIAEEDLLAQRGKFRVSSLRNVAITAPYMHNGMFKDLRTVLLFYNKYNSTNVQAQTNPETQTDWGPPEISDNIDTDKLKSVFLVERQIDALMAFLYMLTDARYEHLLP